MSRATRTSGSARWSLGALVVVLALVVAIWPRSDAEDTEPASALGGVSVSEQGSGQAPVDDGELAELRADARLTGCPDPAQAAGSEAALTEVNVSCLADGSPVELASALAGKPAIVNLWAYWCAPCAEELPYLQQFSDRADGAVTVLTVHTDPNESAALARLADYGVTLPGVQDTRAQVQSTVGAPAVLPVSVLIRADGTVARVLPQPFHSVDEIAAVVKANLGVAA